MLRRCRRAGGLAALSLCAIALTVLVPASPPRLAHALSPADESHDTGECVACHDGAVAGGHPVDVRPRRVALGDGWPLDGNGRMTCLTCHVDCGRHALASDDTSTSRSFLRGNAVARQFCERCHRPRERGGRAIAHGRVFPIAHPRAALVASGGSDASVIDGASRICLGCHDGTIGVAAESLGLERPVPGADLTSHPVGVPQPVTSERTGDTWLVPRESVDPRIVLDGEGRLGCLSCHDLYSREAGLLVMSNRESGLCFGCHEL